MQNVVIDKMELPYWNMSQRAFTPWHVAKVPFPRLAKNAAVSALDEELDALLENLYEMHQALAAYYLKKIEAIVFNK